MRRGRKARDLCRRAEAARLPAEIRSRTRGAAMRANLARFIMAEAIALSALTSGESDRLGLT